MPNTFIENVDVSMSSLNILKDTITATSATKPNTSLGALRDWFRDNIGDNGNFTNTGWGKIGMSEFRERFIYGFYARGWSETASKYKNANNGKVVFKPRWGDEYRTNFSFKVEGKAWTTPNSDNEAIFSGLNSGDYQSYAQHRVDRSRVGFTIRIGYGNDPTYLIRRGNSGVQASHDIRDSLKFFECTKGKFA